MTRPQPGAVKQINILMFCILMYFLFNLGQVPSYLSTQIQLLIIILVRRTIFKKKQHMKKSLSVKQTQEDQKYTKKCSKGNEEERTNLKYEENGCCEDRYEDASMNSLATVLKAIGHHIRSSSIYYKAVCYLLITFLSLSTFYTLSLSAFRSLNFERTSFQLQQYQNSLTELNLKIKNKNTHSHLKFSNSNIPNPRPQSLTNSKDQYLQKNALINKHAEVTTTEVPLKLKQTNEFNDAKDKDQLNAAKAYDTPMKYQNDALKIRPEQSPIDNMNLFSVPIKNVQTNQYRHNFVGVNSQPENVLEHKIAGITEFQKIRAYEWKDLKNFQSEELLNLASQQRKYYQSKYKISQYKQLPICVVIPSYNNAQNDRYLKNMKSILAQEYTNYHIVFIDDASTDNTASSVQNLLKSQTVIGPDKYQIIRNQNQKKAMFNLRRAAKQFCKPQEIFMIVDGDDELIGRQVFKLFSAVFQQNDIWFMYTNFVNLGSIGYSRPFPQNVIDENKYRVHPFVTSHLRAFYTQLFLNIKEEDLQDEDNHYFQAANDVAICIPVLQQAHKRVMYVPQLTYLYNSNTGLNNHMVRLGKQKSNDRKVRQKTKYQPLVKLFQNSK